MKVLFLDIDGVLNSRRSAEAFGGYPHSFNIDQMAMFDKTALALIRKVVRKTRCAVVLSSSWRIGMEPVDTAAGLDLPIIDHTPVSWEQGRKRGDEIKQWLAANPEVTKYAIVDDDSDMLDEQKPFFVKTDHINGLSWENYERLMELLS